MKKLYVFLAWNILSICINGYFFKKTNNTAMVKIILYLTFFEIIELEKYEIPCYFVQKMAL